MQFSFRQSRVLAFAAAASLAIVLFWSADKLLSGVDWLDWHTPASEFAVMLFPIMAYAGAALVLIGLSLDLAPDRQSNDDLDQLLVLKQRGNLSVRSGRARGFRAGHLPTSSAIAVGQPDEMPLERLLGVKRLTTLR